MTGEKKGFMGKLLDRLDKSLEDKSKKKRCSCCDSKEDRGCCG